MFLINKQKWHNEELTSSCMQLAKMQILMKVSFFDLDRIFNDGFTHLRDPTSFFLNYQLISREQVC